MYDVKPGQLVECDWIDPAAASGWKDASEVTACWRFVCRSVGYVHAVGSDGLVLTACYGEDPEGDQSLLLRQHLPWECIKTLWVLQTSEKTKIGKR